MQTTRATQPQWSRRVGLYGEVLSFTQSIHDIQLHSTEGRKNAAKQPHEHRQDYTLQ
jgi:hypothetical protein